MYARPKLLWVGSVPAPASLHQAAQNAWDVVPYSPQEPLAPQIDRAALTVVCPNGHSGDAQWMSELLGQIGQTPAIPLFLLGDDAAPAQRILTKANLNHLCLSDRASAEELAAHLRALAGIAPLAARLQGEIADARSMSDKAAKTMEELDEEMRLASRLQRDFLPRRLPEVGPARFSVLYRPYTFVSGDLYDVVRLDERHVGFYVADVVGHGMPAALLTMFIKKAIQTKRIVGNSYEIVPPDVSLKELNTDICEQNLSSCQFCTAVYCVLDTQTLSLTHARGGHPEPIVIHDDGQVERLWVDGSLLGVFDQEQYQLHEKILAPGDRLVLYTDGAEEVLRKGPGGELLPLERSMKRWAGMSREEMLLQITAQLESDEENQLPDDDVTILVMDVGQ